MPGGEPVSTPTEQPFGLGRLMAFLFIFQTVLVAPLSVAGGAVGFADYVQFVWTDLPPLTHHLIAAAVCIASSGTAANPAAARSPTRSAKGAHGRRP